MSLKIYFSRPNKFQTDQSALVFLFMFWFLNWEFGGIFFAIDIIVVVGKGDTDLSPKCIVYNLDGAAVYFPKRANAVKMS